MMTRAIGRLLRLAAAAAVAGLAVGCASPQGPTAMTAPPGFGKDTASRVVRLVQYCDRLVQKGELVTALGLCGRAHEIDPDNPEPLMKLSGILQALDRPQAAAATYGAVLERHPQHHEALYRLGKLYMETGEAALAVVHFDRATRSNPQDPRPYNALGILRDQAGEHEAAQKLYRLALERDAANLSVRNNLGLSLALDGKRDEAIEVLAELAVDPQAGQTVLRNLEAAYASRTLPPADTAVMPTAPGAPLGDPVEPVASEPLGEPLGEPLAGPAPEAATLKQAPDRHPAGPEAGAPTPLFLPPAAESDAPRQPGADQSEAAPVHAGGSTILAAAESLMEIPDWATFEPGILLPEMPTPTASEVPPPGDTFDDAEFENTQLRGGTGSPLALALLLLDDGVAAA